MIYHLKMLWQKIIRGYSDEQWFNACDYIAAYALPLIKELRAKGNGEPEGLVEGEWEAILDEIIEVWEMDDIRRMKNREKTQRAMEHFGKYFYSLWD